MAMHALINNKRLVRSVDAAGVEFLLQGKTDFLRGMGARLQCQTEWSEMFTRPRIFQRLPNCLERALGNLICLHEWLRCSYNQVVPVRCAQCAQNLVRRNSG